MLRIVLKFVRKNKSRTKVCPAGICQRSWIDSVVASERPVDIMYNGRCTKWTKAVELSTEMTWRIFVHRKSAIPDSKPSVWPFDQKVKHAHPQTHAHAHKFYVEIKLSGRSSVYFPQMAVCICKHSSFSECVCVCARLGMNYIFIKTLKNVITKQMACFASSHLV